MNGFMAARRIPHIALGKCKRIADGLAGRSPPADPVRKNVNIIINVNKIRIYIETA